MESDAASPEFDLFVVYASADADFVRGYLLPALNLPSSRVLLVDKLMPGAPLVSEIARGVSRSRFTVVVLSPAYLADRWPVFGEQLASYLSVEDVHVIPLRRADCKLPLDLEFRVTLDFTDRASWDPEVARLRELLQTTAPAGEQIACPYPGMRPFAAIEASRFFGRDKEIDALIGRLDRGEREIYVIGPSGSGKSSLVQAGLLHVLEAGSSRLGRSFVVRIMRPGDRPADRLAKALEADLATLIAAIDAFMARHVPAERILVFVDQLEELFTLADAVERHRFIQALRTLREDVRCYLLFALRADFYGALMDSELWPDLAGISRLDVAPLRGPALAHAITTPASRVGVYLEARLCDRLIADAAVEPGALPLIQETLRLLWDKRRERLIGLAEYQALGDGGRGLDAAIAGHADATMRALKDLQRPIARRVLLRLVTFGEGRPDTRRQQQVRALRAAADDEAEFSRVLQHLVDKRLVTVDGAKGADDALADLSHEALITAWPALREWISLNKTDEQRRRRLEAKVSEWIDHGRGAASWLDVVGLSEAAQWMQSDAARELGYGPELRELVAASQRQIDNVERQTKEVQRLAGMTYLEQGRSLLLDGHPLQALPYFVAARIKGIESRVLRMLFAQASRSLPLVTFAGHSSLVLQASFSPDGTRVVTGGEDMTTRVWDVSTGRPVTPPLEYRGRFVSVKFSPDGTRVITITNRDGRRVLTASNDVKVWVWDALTGKPVLTPLDQRSIVRTAAFSPDGTRMVTGSDDFAARVWDASTGELVTPPLEHQGEISTVAFSPDGLRVVTASYDQTARVWDASTGTPVTAPLEHHGKVETAAFSPDGTRVVTKSGDKTTRVWDASTGNPVTAPLEHPSDVATTAFSPDGTRVLTASNDGTVRVWNASTGELVTSPLEHAYGAVFSPEGTRVLTMYSHNVQVWDASTGTLVIPPLEHGTGLYAAEFSPDGTRVLTAGMVMARVWDASTGIELLPRSEHRSFIHSAAFSPDGRHVVTASRDKMARIWDASMDARVTQPLEHKGIVWTAVFSPDSTRVVTASSDGTARVWDASTSKPVTPPLMHQEKACAAAFSADGMRVVTASSDFTARIWNASTGKPIAPPLEHRSVVHTATFSPDGTRVVTASNDCTARVWNAATGKPMTPPLEHQGEVSTAIFSPDGTRVVTASNGGTAWVWDASTGKPVTPPLEHQGKIYAAAFSPDGTRVVTASDDGTARVWDASTGTPVTPALEHQGRVYTGVFSPDGTRVVTASYDRTARVWDASNGNLVTPPLEHQRAVRTAVFSPDGTRVVTASDDRTARVWDSSTGKPMTLPLRHQGIVWTAAFSPDGMRVVTASDDNTARVWAVPIDMGSLEEWCLLARCSPFALVDGVLTANPDPLRVYPRH